MSAKRLNDRIKGKLRKRYLATVPRYHDMPQSKLPEPTCVCSLCLDIAKKNLRKHP